MLGNADDLLARNNLEAISGLLKMRQEKGYIVLLSSFKKYPALSYQNESSAVDWLKFIDGIGFF
jgi:hypothetical protein